MILWHMGLAAALVYMTLGRSRIDYRYILTGAVLPDVIDGLLQFLGVMDSPSGRGAAHSLLWIVVLGAVIILAFKGERRLAVFGIAVGWLTHLAADGIWDSPKTLLWPLFGDSFEATPAEPYSWSLFSHPFSHWTTWLGEFVGLGILIWFFIAFQLNDPERRRHFLKDGHLRA